MVRQPREALGKHSAYFSDLYLATIRAGSSREIWPSASNGISRISKLMIGLRQKVTKALAYPAFLVVVGIAVVGFLLELCRRPSSRYTANPRPICRRQLGC